MISYWAGASIFSCPWPLDIGAPCLKPLDSALIILWAFLVLQLVDSILWHISASIIILANAQNKFPLSVYPIGSLSLDKPHVFSHHPGLSRVALIVALLSLCCISVQCFEIPAPDAQ